MVKTKVKKGNVDDSPRESTLSSRSALHSRTQAKEPQGSNIATMLNIVVILLVVVIVLLIISIFSGSAQSQGSDSQVLNDINEKVTRLDNFFRNNIPEYEDAPAQDLTPENFPTIQRPTIENRPVKGDLNAPITLVEYSDFACQFCERFFSQTYPRLMEFVDEGTINFVYKHFPVVGGENPALASACVFLEEGTDMFYNFHDRIFEEHARNRSGIISLSNLREWAIELGANEANYDDCMSSNRAQELVQQDFQEAQSIGVTGTPSVAINDKLIVGACPISTFERAIALELEGTPFFVRECQVITG